MFKKNPKILIRLNNDRSNIYFIHYSSQSLSDNNEGYSPRVTSIAILHLASSQMHSFSMHLVAEELHIPREEIEKKYDEIEKQLLKKYFLFIESIQEEAIWVHWNMTNINFGFEALEHRYRVLTKLEPIKLSEKKKFNLSSILSKKYGKDYVKHPKMKNLMELNGGIHRMFLTGEEEVSAYKAMEYVKLHNSTMSKVYFFRDAFNKTVNNKLRTNNNTFKYFIDDLYKNPIVQILGILGIIGTLVSLIWQLWIHEIFNSEKNNDKLENLSEEEIKR